MKSILKKLILGIAAILLAGFVTVPAYAAELDDETSMMVEQAETFAGVVAGRIDENIEILEEGYFGEDGNNLHWALSENGEFVIVGTGSMGDDIFVGYGDEEFQDERPWINLKDEIKIVYVDEGVTDILDEAFLGMKNLKIVYISSTVKHITKYIWNEVYEYYQADFPFSECISLEKIIVSEDNAQYYTDENGILFGSSVDGEKELVYFPAGLEMAEYRVPNDVKSVAYSSFNSTMGLDKLIIPDTVTYVDESTFYKADGIKSLTLPKSVSEDAMWMILFNETFNSMEEYIISPAHKDYCTVDGIVYSKDMKELSKCPARKDGVVKVPEGVQIIGQRSFSKCRKVTGIELADSVTEFGAWAFVDCYNLKSLEIGPKVDVIINEAFAWSPFEKFTVDSANKYFKSIDGVIYNKKGTKLVMCPTEKKGELTIPKEVTQIGMYGFWNCQIDKVKFKGVVESVSSDAFYASKIKEVDFPEGLTHIGDYAFYDCLDLEKVTIPKSVTSIGINVFEIYDEESYEDVANTNVTIYGYENSYAEGIAKVAGIEFISLGTVTPHVLYSDYDQGVHQVIESSGVLRVYGDPENPGVVDCVMPNYYDSDSDSEYWEMLEKVWCITVEDGVAELDGLGGLDNVTTIVITSDDLHTLGEDAFGWTWVYNEDEEEYEKDRLRHFTAYVKKDSKAFDYVVDHYIDFEYLSETTCPKHITAEMQIKKASTSANGSESSVCKLCEKQVLVRSIPQISSNKTKLSKTSYVYDGKAKSPTLTVYDVKGKKLVKGKDYTVKYNTTRKNVGKHTVTITFKGDYKGTLKKTFTINPASTSLKSLAKGKKQITVKWNKKTNQVTGYQIQLSTSSKFTNSTTKTVKITSNKTISKKVTGLKANKKYYVRIRTYKKAGDSTYYSAWSKVKNVKTK